MTTRIRAFIDEKNVTSDWIYEELGKTIGCVYPSGYHKAAFYFENYLYEAEWISGGTFVHIFCVSHYFKKEGLEKIKEKLKSIFKSVERPLVTDISTFVDACYYTDDRIGIEVNFYYEDN